MAVSLYQYLPYGRLLSASGSYRQINTDLFRLGEGLIQSEGEDPGRLKANPLIIGHSGGEGGSLNPDHPFTEAGVDSALECLDGRYATFPRSDIARLTDIEIPPNKRNGQKQADHLEEARAIRDIRQRRKGGNWWDGGGRPKGSGTKRDAIRAYTHEHPEASHSAIARALGVSRPTVIKWIKPGWREEWEREKERRSAVLSLRRDDEGRWVIAKLEGHPEPEGRILDLPDRHLGDRKTGLSVNRKNR